MQNVVGPTLVAMATKFGLKSPVCLFVTLLHSASFLFLDRIEPFFGRHFSMYHSMKLFCNIISVAFVLFHH